MNRAQAEQILTAEQAARCAEIGKAWGQHEVECWNEEREAFAAAYDPDFAHCPKPAREMREWTMGAYCGDLNEFARLPYPDTSEDPGHDREYDAAMVIRDAAEYLIDCAAREVWNAAQKTAHVQKPETRPRPMTYLQAIREQNRPPLADVRTPWNIVELLLDIEKTLDDRKRIELADWLACLLQHPAVDATLTEMAANGGYGGGMNAGMNAARQAAEEVGCYVAEPHAA